MARELEKYCAKLVSDALGGARYEAGYRFPFLRGDPTKRHPLGVTLPVDAYYLDFNLVLEFREVQHYGDVALWDKRITATGETRKQQRRRYDERREQILPANGIRLIIIYDHEITQEYEADLRMARQKLGMLGDI